MLIRKIEDVMTTSVVSISRAGTIAEAIGLMARHRISALVVMDGDIPAGVVTEARLLSAAAHAPEGAGSVDSVRDPLALTFHPHDSTLDAVISFERTGMTAAVVIDGEGRLAGIVTLTNILTGIEDGHFTSRQKVKHTATRKVILVTEMTTIHECIQLMVKEGADSVIVTAKGVGTGIFTRRDAVRLLSQPPSAEGRPQMRDPVYKHMTSPLVTVNGETTVFEACHLMEQKRIRRIVVVDARDQPRGVLLQSDLLRRLDANYSEMLRRAVGEAGTRMALSESRYRAIVESSLEAVYIITGGRFTYVNRKAAELFGMTENEMTGRPFLQLVHPDDARDLDAELALRADGENEEEMFRFRGLKKDGRISFVESRAKAVGGTGERAVMGIFRDVTEETTAHEEAERQNRFDSLLYKVALILAGGNGDTDSRLKETCAALTKDLGLTVCEPVFIDTSGRSGIIEALGRVDQGAVKTFNPKVRIECAEYPLLDRAVSKRQPVVFGADDADVPAMERDHLARLGAEAAVYVPMEAEGRPFGVLIMGGPSTLRAEWERNAQFILSFAGRLGAVCEKARLHARLRESEAQYRELFDTAVDVIFKVDRHGLIEDANAQFTIAIGYDPADWIGKPFVHLLAAPEHGAVLEDRSERFIGGEFLLNTSFGHRYFYISSWPRYSSDGTMTGNWRSARDITLNKRKEDELMATKERAEAANRAKSAFLANMSHELRTPLTAIIGFGNLIGDNKALSREIMEQGRIVAKQGKNLLALINNVLDLVDAEKKQPPSLRQPVCVADVVRVCVEREVEHAQEQHTTLTAELDPSLPDIILSDEHFLSHALELIVNNAVKFTTGGNVTVSAGRDGQLLLFTVTDTGIGMDEGHLSSIFNAFSQVDESITRRYGGIGIGLPLAKAHIAALGGQIGVKSAPGKGTVVHFTIPLSTPGDGTDTATLNVLAADDDQTTRLLIRDILLKAGYRVKVVAGGEQAVEACRGESFDALILDIVMPEMNGLEVLFRVRQMPDYKHIPFIALTVKTKKEEREVILAQGFDHYIPKPFRPLDLLETLELAVGGKAKER